MAKILRKSKYIGGRKKRSATKKGRKSRSRSRSKSKRKGGKK